MSLGSLLLNQFCIACVWSESVDEIAVARLEIQQIDKIIRARHVAAQRQIVLMNNRGRRSTISFAKPDIIQYFNV